MFDLFKRAGELRFQLFKIAYSLREELDWVRTVAGRKRLGGLLWELARAPASEDAIDRAADELLAFIGAATPSGLDDNAAGESAWWLRGIALDTPYGTWPGLLAAAAGLRSDLAAYWENRASIKDLFGARVTQLSGVSGASGLRELIGKLGPAQAEAERQQRLERLRKIEAERAALPTGQLQLLGVVGDWRIEVPHDGAAAVHAGHRSSWCTARKPEEHFSSYYNPGEGRFIYVFVNMRDGSRYQAAFAPDGSIEVRDDSNELTDNRTAIQLYRALKSLGKLPHGAEGLEHYTHMLDLGPLGVQLGRPNTDENGEPHTADDAPAHRFVNPVSKHSTAAWYRNGRLHREDGPAITVEHPGGSQTHVWYRDGVPSRGDGGPTMTRSLGRGSAREDSHLEADGKVGRDPAAGPAIIRYSEDGAIKEYSYMRGGRLAPAPAANIPSFNNGETQTWANARGETHRDGAPAVVRDNAWDPGSSHEEWHRNGKKHRDGGPAVSGYSGNVNQHWNNGVRVRANGTPYSDALEAAIDDMRRVKAGPGLDKAAGLVDWSDVVEGLEVLRDELLDGYIKRIITVDFRIDKIAELISNFSSRSGKAAAMHILSDFSAAGQKLVSG